MAKRKTNRLIGEYTPDYKLTVVKPTRLEGLQNKTICECLDLHLLMVSRWRKEARVLTRRSIQK